MGGRWGELVDNGGGVHLDVEGGCTDGCLCCTPVAQLEPGVQVYVDGVVFVHLDAEECCTGGPLDGMFKVVPVYKGLGSTCGKL